jgi:transcriptional regulator with XRE-family HTH domain
MREEPLNTESIKIAVGQRIKALRKRRGLTLEKFSARTGLSVSLLSQIEHGGVNLSVANLWKIAQTLGAEIAYFFEQNTPYEAFKVVRSNERKQVIPHRVDPEFFGYSHEHLFSFISEGPVEVFKVEIDQLTEKQMKFNTHPGMELILILEGDIEFVSKDANERYRIILHPGDTLRFLAKHPHAYRALASKAQVVGILYTASSQELADFPEKLG